MSNHNLPSIESTTAPPTTRLPSPDGKPLLTSILLGTVIFIGGGVFGAAGAFLLSEEELPEPDSQLILREDFPDIMSARVQERFELTDEQRDQVRGIFARYVPRMREVRHKIEPQMREIVVPLSIEISEIMTPEQAELWRQEMKQRAVDRLGGPR